MRKGILPEGTERWENSMVISNWNEYRYWSVIRSVGFSMLFFLLFFNAVRVIFWVLQITLPMTGMSPEAVYLTEQLVYDAGYLAAFMLPVPILKTMIRSCGYSFRPIKTAPRLSPWLPLILFAGVAAILALSYCNLAAVSIFEFGQFSDTVLWQDSADPENYEIVLDFIGICLVPAFCEEFLFRGAILTNCLPFGRGTAIIVSALMFALMHGNIGQILYTFGAGILLGVVYEKTGSIWNTVFLHLVNNFFSVFEDAFSGVFRTGSRLVIRGVLECAVALIGMVCAVILIVRFCSGRKDLRDGVYGRSVPASDLFAECPVRSQSAFRLAVNVPMVAFVLLSIGEMLIAMILYI